MGKKERERERDGKNKEIGRNYAANRVILIALLGLAMIFFFLFCEHALFD